MIGLTSLLKCSVVHTWRSFLFILMMEGIQLQRALSDDPDAVRKRKNRADLREKRRQDAFANKYIQIKHPNIYAKIKTTYKVFFDKYPQSCDITKTYYFRKWEKQVRQQQVQLYAPHLPILADLHEATNPRLEIVEEGLQCQEQIPQSPAQEETPQPPAQEEIPQPPSQEETPQPPTHEETLHPQNNNLFSGMSLDDMEIAAQEIVRALESEQDLMDMVENFDLPDSVWCNELTIPDYVLEGDLEW